MEFSWFVLSPQSVGSKGLDLQQNTIIQFESPTWKVQKWTECMKSHRQSSVHSLPQPLRLGVFWVKFMFLKVWRISSYLSSLFLKKSVLKSPSLHSSYPPTQHLKNPPFLRHFLAKLLNSAFRQSFQTKLGSTVSPDPGDRWTKSIPQVFFQIFMAEILWDLDFISTYFLHFLLFFVKSFQTLGSSKLKKYWKSTLLFYHDKIDISNIMGGPTLSNLYSVNDENKKVSLLNGISSTFCNSSLVLAALNCPIS